LRRAGKFFAMVAWSVVSCAEAAPLQSKLTVGGVHVADAFTWLWHCPVHCALALHEGGVTWPSHVGAIAVPVQPPRHVALAPQLTPAFPVILQSPLQVPWHVPAQ
jgi:hypothetical protein